MDSIALSWSPVEGATTYKVFRAESEKGPYTWIADVPSLSHSDRVGEENQGKWYWYTVRACNAAGCGRESSPARGYAGRPPKPENIQASKGDYPNKIVIKWEEIPGATSYQLFRDPSPRPDCQGLCSLTETDTSYYEDVQVRVGIRYRYAVRASNRFGSSELSNTDYGCVNPCPLPFSLDAE